MNESWYIYWHWRRKSNTLKKRVKTSLFSTAFVTPLEMALLQMILLPYGFPDMSCGLFLTGIPNRHHLCPDLDRQPSQIQQHNENTDFKQQYGWTYLATRHHLQKLQEGRFTLDYNAQPAAPDMEWWKDTLHPEVNTKINIEVCLSVCLPVWYIYYLFMFVEVYLQ